MTDKISGRTSGSIADELIKRAKVARISVLQLQRNAGVGNTTIYRWRVSKTGIFCTETARKLFDAMADAEMANAEWESAQ